MAASYAGGCRRGFGAAPEARELPRTRRGSQLPSRVASGERPGLGQARAEETAPLAYTLLRRAGNMGGMGHRRGWTVAALLCACTGADLEPLGPGRLSAQGDTTCLLRGGDVTCWGENGWSGVHVGAAEREDPSFTWHITEVGGTAVDVGPAWRSGGEADRRLVRRAAFAVRPRSQLAGSSARPSRVPGVSPFCRRGPTTEFGSECPSVLDKA